MSFDTDATAIFKNGTDEYEMNTIRVLSGKVFINISIYCVPNVEIL